MALSRQDFVTTYTPLAGDIGSQTGMDPDVVLGLIAQETGWGNHFVGNNVFGISPPPGGVANYRSIPEGAQAFVDLLKQPRYAGVSGADDQAGALAAAGYNPNRGYAGSVNANVKQIRSLRDSGSGAPSADDLFSQVKQVQGQATPAEQAAPAAAPSADELLQSVQQMRGPAAPQTPAVTTPPPAQAASPDNSWLSPETAAAARNALAPTPGWTYGEILPLARNEQTGDIRLAMPGMLRSTLQGFVDLGQGPGGMQVNPLTMTPSLTPEAQGALATLVNPDLRFGTTPNALDRLGNISGVELRREPGAAPQVAEGAPPGPTPGAPPGTAPGGPAGPAGAPPGPQPGMGGPQPQAAGAQATPPGLAQFTPQEIEAYRKTAEGQKLTEPQPIGIPDRRQLVPGVNPNLAEQEQTVEMARELKALGIQSQDVSQAAKDAAQANNEARTNYFKQTAGSQADISREQTLRQADINAAKPQVFDPANVTGPVSMQPALDRIDQILDIPENRENTPLQTVLGNLRQRFVDADGNARTMEPAQAWGLRQDIDRLTDANMQRTDPNLHYVAHDLGTISDILDTGIEGSAPGYRDMLNTYRQHSQNIAVMRVLQQGEKGLINPGDPLQTIRYSNFQRFMKNVVDQRATPDFDMNDYKAIPADTLQRLWDLRDDLRRSASATELARAPGSDTAQNIMDLMKTYAKLGGNAAVHGIILHTLGPGGNVAYGGIQAATAPIRAARAARRAQRQILRRGREMLYPDNPLTPP